MKFANLKIPDLQSNSVFLGFIPDYISRKHKLIIEIDGDYHHTIQAIKKDKLKDSYYKKAGYTVVRIKAYSDTSLLAGFTKIKEVLSGRYN